MNALILGPRTLGSSYLGAIIHSVFNWALWNAYMHWIMIFITMNCGFCSPQIASLLLIKELWHVWYLYLFRNNKVQMMSFFENEPNSFAPCGNILLYYQLINIIYHWSCSMWMKGLLRIHFCNRIKFPYLILRLTFWTSWVRSRRSAFFFFSFFVEWPF